MQISKFAVLCTYQISSASLNGRFYFRTLVYMEYKHPWTLGMCSSLQPSDDELYKLNVPSKPELDVDSARGSSMDQRMRFD
jgi:hypothetical protein